MTHTFIKSILAATVLASATIFSTPAESAPPAKAFGELPVGFDADISPDGKRLAVILNSGGQYYAASRELNSTSPELQAVPLGDGVSPLYIRWVNDDRYFVSFSKREEYEGVPFTTGHIYTHDVEENEGELLLKPTFFQQFNNTIVDWMEGDDEHVLMSYYTRDRISAGTSLNRERKKFPGVYRVDVENGKGKRVQEGRENIDYWYASPDGTPVVGVGEDKGGNDVMTIKGPDSTRWESDDNYPDLTADMPIFAVMKGGTELIIGDYAGRDTLGIYKYDLVNRRRTDAIFHNDKYDASGVVVTRDRETVIAANYVADEQQTEPVGEYRTLLNDLESKFPGFSVRFVDQTDDGNTIIVKLSAPYEPGGLYLYSKGDAQPTLIQTTYSGLHSNDMGNVTAMNYTARDGEKISGFITLPPAIKTQADFKSVPFIILPHGGPYGRDEKRFDYLAQFFATRGYAVMQMNFRGSEGYGKSFEEAGRNNWLIMQEDVEDATKYLFSKGYADPDRTCIAGWSYGGYAALMGAAKDDENRYSCVIAMAALTDINSAREDMKDYKGGRAAAERFFGDAMRDWSVRRENSPVHLADQIKVPVFMAHGDMDVNVRFDQFEKMKKELEKAGVDGTYLAFEDEDHYLSRQENREAFFEGVESFLLKVNGPSEFMAK